MISEPTIGVEVAINSLEGTLIASSLFGITALDVFDEVITSHEDLNTFLIDNGQPKRSVFSSYFDLFSLKKNSETPSKHNLLWLRYSLFYSFVQSSWFQLR